MLELRDLQLMRQAVIELLLFVVSHVGLSCLLYFLMLSLKDLVQSVNWSSVGVGGFDQSMNYSDFHKNRVSYNINTTNKAKSNIIII